MALERIRHHANRAVTSAKKAAAHMKTRSPWWGLLGVALGIVVILSLLHLDERNDIVLQNRTFVINCQALIFNSNERACEQSTVSILSSLPPIEREICDTDNMNYRNNSPSTVSRSSMVTLCSEYNDAVIAVLRGRGLIERGVSIWEREPIVKNAGDTINTMTSVPSMSMTLICNGALVSDMTRIAENRVSIIVNKSVNGECELVAMIPQGSLTSEKFNLTVE